MELTELRHAAPFPPRPPLGRARLGGARVAIEDADAVAVASEQHRAAEPGDASADDDDVGHGSALRR